MVSFEQSGYIRAKVVLFGQKKLFSGKTDCIRAKNGCILAKVDVNGQSGCIQGKVVVIGQSGCIRTKEIVFGQKWLYLGNVVVFG